MAPLWLTIGSVSLGETSKVSDGITTFEVGLDAISTKDLDDTFKETLCVGYINVTFGFNFFGSRLGTCCASDCWPHQKSHWKVC